MTEHYIPYKVSIALDEKYWLIDITISRAGAPCDASPVLEGDRKLRSLYFHKVRTTTWGDESDYASLYRRPYRKDESTLVLRIQVEERNRKENILLYWNRVIADPKGYASLLEGLINSKAQKPLLSPLTSVFQARVEEAREQALVDFGWSEKLQALQAEYRKFVGDNVTLRLPEELLPCLTSSQVRSELGEALKYVSSAGGFDVWVPFMPGNLHPEAKIPGVPESEQP